MADLWDCGVPVAECNGNAISSENIAGVRGSYKGHGTPGAARRCARRYCEKRNAEKAPGDPILLPVKPMRVKRVVKEGAKGHRYHHGGIR